MKIPDMPRKGFPVSETVGGIIRYLRANRITNVQGGKIRHSPSGSTIEVTQQRRSTSFDTKPPLWVSLVDDSGTWKYRVSAGYATYQNIGSGDVVGYVTPTLGGTSLEADPAPEGTLPGNASYIYLKVQTGAKGVITGTPTIEASTSAQTSGHHEPPDPDDGSGTLGTYYFLLAQTEDDGGSPGKPQMVRRITGNKHVPNQLVEFDNIGAGKEIHRDYLNATDDKHELRTINERASTPQIQVNYSDATAADAEEIIIEGNGYDASESGKFVTELTAVDGLITAIATKDFGGDLNLSVYWLTYNRVTVDGTADLMQWDSESSTPTIHYWRDGIYEGTTDPGDSPAGLIEESVTLMVDSVA